MIQNAFIMNAMHCRNGISLQRECTTWSVPLPREERFRWSGCPLLAQQVIGLIKLGDGTRPSAAWWHLQLPRQLSGRIAAVPSKRFPGGSSALAIIRPMPRASIQQRSFPLPLTGIAAPAG